MSDLLDRLGLQGPKRLAWQRAWGQWASALSLPDEAMPDFISFMLEHSWRVEGDGFPPGFNWVQDCLEGAVASSILSDRLLPIQGALRINALAAARRERLNTPGHQEQSASPQHVWLDQVTGTYLVQVIVSVLRVDGELMTEGMYGTPPRDAVEKAWGLWSYPLGLRGEAFSIARDYILEHSEEIPHGVFPPHFSQPVWLVGLMYQQSQLLHGERADVFRRGWPEDPELQIWLGAPVLRNDNPNWAWVQGWREIRPEQIQWEDW